MTARNLTDRVLGHCNAAILEYIHGRDGRKVQFMTLSDGGSAECLESLRQRFIASRKYPVKQACGVIEFKKSGDPLRSFSSALNKLPLDDRNFRDNIRLYNTVLQKAAALRKDKVLFPILDMSFVQTPTFIKYLERLARYKVGMNTISELQKRNSGPWFSYPGEIEFTEPRRKEHPLPTLTELDPNDTSFYPPRVRESYYRLLHLL